ERPHPRPHARTLLSRPAHDLRLRPTGGAVGVTSPWRALCSSSLSRSTEGVRRLRPGVRTMPRPPPQRARRGEEARSAGCRERSSCVIERGVMPSEPDPIAGRRLLLMAWLVVVSCGLGCDLPGAPRAGREVRNVVLISLDTTRADYLGAYNPARGPTPRIDALARDWGVFEQRSPSKPITP